MELCLQNDSQVDNGELWVLWKCYGILGNITQLYNNLLAVAYCILSCGLCIKTLVLGKIQDVRLLVTSYYVQEDILKIREA